MSDGVESNTRSFSHGPLRIVDLLDEMKAALEEESWSPDNTLDETEAVEFKKLLEKENIVAPVQSNSASFDTVSFEAPSNVSAPANKAVVDTSTDAARRRPFQDSNRAVSCSATNSAQPWYKRPISSVKKPPPKPVEKKSEPTTPVRVASRDDSLKGSFYKLTLCTVEEQDSPQLTPEVAPVESTPPTKDPPPTTKEPPSSSSEKTPPQPASVCSSPPKSSTPSESDPPDPKISEKTVREPSPKTVETPALKTTPEQASNAPERVAETPKVTNTDQLANLLGLPRFKTILVNGKNYLILAKLGIGGSSEVFKVLDPVDSSLYAIKCVNLAVESSLAQSYINEIRLLKRLQGSERVVTMYEFEYDQKKKMLHVVMELGDTDLSNVLKSHTTDRTLPGPLVLAYWIEMLSAVDHIHSIGIIHSDLKPANFLLVRGHLKLIDFGIASSISSDATSVLRDSAAGTFNYISPEAIFGQREVGNQIKISCRSDVWSLGCILYSFIYGKTPFGHITKQYAKIAAIGDPKYTISFPKVTHVPAVLIDALRWCLTYDVKKRPWVKQLLNLPYMGFVETVPIAIQRKIRNALTKEEWEIASKALQPTGISFPLIRK